MITYRIRHHPLEPEDLVDIDAPDVWAGFLAAIGAYEAKTGRKALTIGVAGGGEVEIVRPTA